MQMRDMNTCDDHRDIEDPIAYKQDKDYSTQRLRLTKVPTKDRKAANRGQNKRARASRRTNRKRAA